MQVETERDCKKYSKVFEIIFDSLKHKYSFLNETINLFKFKFLREFNIKNKYYIIIVFIPLNVLKKFRKAQLYFIEEFERKFLNTSISFVGLRTIIPLKYQMSANKKTYKKSFTNVAEEFVKDAIFPAVIVGKRIFFYANNETIYKIFIKDCSNCINSIKSNLISESLYNLFSIDLDIEIIKETNLFLP
mmetsp:Transcript_21997/g.30698  ORF Transcript_21997/g.30698 Transcript_21997/m.30698 type:complete len:189 (-) Transcript_21997:147-713(-)